MDPAPADDPPVVLIVDDEPAIRDLLRIVLEDEGFRVVVARHGGEALDVLNAGLAPCLILLDMKMPVHDGAEVLQALAGLPAGDAPPVIVISGSAELAPQLGRPPVQRILIKPFGLEELLESVAAATGGAAMR